MITTDASPISIVGLTPKQTADADSDEHRLYAYLRDKAAAGQLRVTIRGGRVLLHCPGLYGCDGYSITSSAALHRRRGRASPEPG